MLRCWAGASFPAGLELRWEDGPVGLSVQRLGGNGAGRGLGRERRGLRVLHGVDFLSGRRGLRSPRETRH
jgi:hypothetical protein